MVIILVNVTRNFFKNYFSFLTEGTVSIMIDRHTVFDHLRVSLIKFIIPIDLKFTIIDSEDQMKFHDVNPKRFL